MTPRATTKGLHDIQASWHLKITLRKEHIDIAWDPLKQSKSNILYTIQDEKYVEVKITLRKDPSIFHWDPLNQSQVFNILYTIPDEQHVKLGKLQTRVCKNKNELKDLKYMSKIAIESPRCHGNKIMKNLLVGNMIKEK